MSHFAVLVLCPETTRKINAAVTRLLAPYNESGRGLRGGTWWDWWQIGGRHTGMLDKDYDPETDPANIEACEYCEGGVTTQAIADHFPAYQQFLGQPCFQCKGTEKRAKWPTQWVPFGGDIKPVAEIRLEQMSFTPFAIVTPDGEWHASSADWWSGDPEGQQGKAVDWQQEVIALLAANPTATAVVVDCHS